MYRCNVLLYYKRQSKLVFKIYVNLDLAYLEYPENSHDSDKPKNLARSTDHLRILKNIVEVLCLANKNTVVLVPD